MRVPLTRLTPLVIAAALFVCLPASGAASQFPDLTASDQGARSQAQAVSITDEIRHALIRLPLAALLGTALAVRPKRRGTPARQPAVIQTQIILAIVGAVVMLVVGTNLARAFGVVGAAGLVRYRAKVEDPKDAGVMLSTLAVGLASGVGQYVMAIFSAGFILLALWVIESFEPEGKKVYIVKIKMGDDTDGRRKEFNAILRKHQVDFELQSSADEEVCYEVH